MTEYNTINSFPLGFLHSYSAEVFTYHQYSVIKAIDYF